MSYDDDIDAIPTLCDSCFAKLEETPPTAGIGWRMLVFKCQKCKGEFCSHIEAKEGQQICLDCDKAEEHGPVDWS